MEHALRYPQLDPSRRVGVEIEMSGLDETAVAGAIMFLLGGKVRPAGPTRVLVSGTSLGNIEIELDTGFAAALAKAPTPVLDLARKVIPCELITDPILETELPQLNQLVHELRIAGAEGSNAALLHGFGVHFNPEAQDLTVAAILPVLQAYAVLEPWLRNNEPMGLARRVLPFTDPWPVPLRDGLTGMSVRSTEMSELIDFYLAEAPSRNYALDLLPLFGHIDGERVKLAMGDSMPSTRPTYHFRLPTSRVGEPNWRVTDEWAKWQLVEQVAADEKVLRRLCDGWSRSALHLIGRERAWVEEVSDFLPRLIS